MDSSIVSIAEIIDSIETTILYYRVQAAIGRITEAELESHTRPYIGFLVQYRQINRKAYNLSCTSQGKCEG